MILITLLTLFALSITPVKQDIEVNYVMGFKCVHTRGKWAYDKGSIAVMSDTLYVYTKTFQYKGRVTRREKVRGRQFIVTDNSSVLSKSSCISTNCMGA